MTDLAISVVDVVADRYAASPQLVAKLRIDESTGTVVHAMALRCQVMVEPQRRAYDDQETAGVVELFGGRDRWKHTLKPFLWTHASTVTRGFTGGLEVDLPIPCSYDVEVAASKYLLALADGELPLRFLFSGTVFSRGETGFAVEHISWDLEAAHRMPVTVWRELMDAFFPGSGWLRLDNDTIAALLRLKAARGLTTWDSVITSLLAEQVADAGEPVA
jgi:hypothetical protein